MAKKWKIGIVGAGYMAREHAKAFASLPNVDIVGVVGRTRAKAAALAAEFSTTDYESIGQLFAAGRPHTVVVAVNELSMRAVCEECFEYPWRCLLEKPVGIDLPDAEAILAASRGAPHYVALNRRSYSSTRQALDLLSHDQAVRLISVFDQQDMNAARAGGQPEAVVKNYMFANSIHLVDYFRVFGRGDITNVTASVPWTPDTPGHVVATIEFSSGDVGVYQATWNGPGPWSVAVATASVRLEMRPLESLGLQRRGERRVEAVQIDPFDTKFKPGLRFQAEELIRALEGYTPSLATLEDATKSMRLCAAIYGLTGQ